MMNFTELPPVPSDRLVPVTESAAAGSGCLPGPFQGFLPRAHCIRPALLPGLAHRTRPGSTGCPPRASGVVSPVDARDPPVQALHGVTPVLSCGRVLPDLRHRRRLGALARRARPAPHGPRRITDPWFTHLQFEALLTAARQSAHPCDFALVAMLGLLGLRIFEATGADIVDLAEEHGHRVLRVCGKGTKVVLIPLPPAVGRAIDRAIGARTSGPILLNQPWRPDGPPRRHPPPAAARRSRRGADQQATSAHAPPYLRDHHARRRGRPARRPDRRPPRRPRTTMRYDRARKNLDRHPNYILAAYMATGT